MLLTKRSQSKRHQVKRAQKNGIRWYGLRKKRHQTKRLQKNHIRRHSLRKKWEASCQPNYFPSDQCARLAEHGYVQIQGLLPSKATFEDRLCQSEMMKAVQCHPNVANKCVLLSSVLEDGSHLCFVLPIPGFIANQGWRNFWGKMVDGQTKWSRNKLLKVSAEFYRPQIFSGTIVSITKTHFRPSYVTLLILPLNVG